MQCYRSVCYWLNMLTVDGSTMGELQKYTDDVNKKIEAFDKKYHKNVGEDIYWN